MFNLADKTNPITVWGYGRASTDKQVLTPAVQKDAIETAFGAYKMLNQFHPDSTYGGFYCDAAESSKVPFFKRPMGDFICTHTEPGDCIIVSKYDRMFRGVVDFCETLESFMARNIRLIMLDWNLDTSTVNGYGMAQILAVIKWMEREATRERTKDALAYLKRIGRPLNGKAHPGYRVVHRTEGGRRRPYFVEDAKDRALCDLIAEWHDTDGLTFEAITLKLERDGYRQPKHPRRGIRPWNYLQVYKRYHARKNGYPLYGIKHDELPAIPTGFDGGVELDDRLHAALRDVS